MLKMIIEKPTLEEVEKTMRNLEAVRDMLRIIEQFENVTVDKDKSERS